MKILCNIYANYCKHIDKLFFWLLARADHHPHLRDHATMLHVIWLCVLFSVTDGKLE